MQLLRRLLQVFQDLQGAEEGVVVVCCVLSCNRAPFGGTLSSRHEVKCWAAGGRGAMGAILVVLSLGLLALILWLRAVIWGHCQLTRAV